MEKRQNLNTKEIALEELKLLNRKKAQILVKSLEGLKYVYNQNDRLQELNKAFLI